MLSVGLLRRRRISSEVENHVKAAEIARIENYLRTRFRNRGISVESRTNKSDSAEVMLDGEYLGIVFRDDEEGETSYDLHVSILEIDLT